MATFIINIQAEFLKSRRTAAWWLTIVAGVLIPLIMMIAYLAKPGAFVKPAQVNVWQAHVNECWESVAAFLLPMYVIMVTSLVIQTEYRNNTWKQVYTSPRSYADIFFSKFVVAQLLILGCLLLFNVAILVSGTIAGAIHPAIGFLKDPVPWNEMLRTSVKMYIAVMGMTAIQYWLSLRFRNYIVPVSIGLAMMIAGLIILKWEYIEYYPYAYSLVSFFFRRNTPGLAIHEWNSLAWFAIVILLAFFDTVKRKEHG